MSVGTTKDAATEAGAHGPGPGSGRDTARASLAAVSLASLALGLVGALLGPDWLRASGLLVFCLVGVGSAAWHRVAALDLYERLALSFATSFGVLTLIPLLMMSVHVWQPGWAFAFVVAVCAPAHGVALARLPRPRAWAPGFAGKAGLLHPGIVAGVGAAICVGAAMTHRHLDPGFYGFLPVVGPAWYVGLALVLGAVTFGARTEAGRALPVFALVLVLTVTPALVYDGPRSQSAAKHVAFVAQIRDLHELASSVPIYNSFSGFFGAMAWLCDICGIPDPMSLAIAWPVVLGVVRVVALRFLAGAVLRSSAQCWVAVVLAVLCDSIGADYFSPQSVGFVVGVLAFGVALDGRLPTRVREGVLLLCGVTLAVSHQLSPFVVGGVLVVLVLLRQVRPWWLPGLVLGPAVTWVAMHWTSVREYLSLDSLGNADNFAPPRTVGVPGLDRLPVVPATILSLVLGVVIVGTLAAVALLRRRSDLEAWALAACPGVGLLLVAVNPYGQEGIFRAVLFGIPWLAILASDLFAARTRGSSIGLFVVCVCLASTFLISSFGLDGTNVIRTSDLAAVRAFEAQGGRDPTSPHYLVLLQPGDQPTTPPEKGGRHFIWGLDQLELKLDKLDVLPPAQRVRLLTDRVEAFTGLPGSRAVVYAMWSQSGANYGRAYALQSSADAKTLRAAFAASEDWAPSSAGEGTFVFRLVGGRPPGTPR